MKFPPFFSIFVLCFHHSFHRTITLFYFRILSFTTYTPIKKEREAQKSFCNGTAYRTKRFVCRTRQSNRNTYRIIHITPKFRRQRWRKLCVVYMLLKMACCICPDAPFQQHTIEYVCVCLCVPRRFVVHIHRCECMYYQLVLRWCFYFLLLCASISMCSCILSCIQSAPIFLPGITKVFRVGLSCFGIAQYRCVWVWHTNAGFFHLIERICSR